MAVVSEKPVASLISQGISVVPPVEHLPVALPTPAPAGLATSLDTYRTALQLFGKASANVGLTGGARVRTPSDLACWLTLVGTTTGASLAGLVAAGQNPGIALAVGAVAAVVGGIMSGEGVFRSWGSRFEDRIREGRAVRPLAAQRLGFLAPRLKNAQPLERTLLGTLSARWLAELDRRHVIGKEARDVLRAVVAEAQGAEPHITAAAARIGALAETLFDAGGALKDDLTVTSAQAILRACEALTPEERASLVPRVREALFAGEKPRVTMSFEACQALLEGLTSQARAE